jgi:hypothetical protein
MDEYKNVPKKSVRLVLIGCLTAFVLFLGSGAYYVYGIYERLELEAMKSGVVTPAHSDEVNVETRSYEREGLRIPIIGIEPRDSRIE